MSENGDDFQTILGTSTDGNDLMLSNDIMIDSAILNSIDGADQALLLDAIRQQQQSMGARSNESMIQSRSVRQSDDDLDDLPEDETIFERIVALQEMFPENVRNVVGTFNEMLMNVTKLSFNKGRTVAWWLSSTMCVLVFPILIQKELLQVAEQMSREQRSILLGPQAASGAFSGSAF